MKLFRNNDGNKSETSEASPNPMKMVQTPQVPTQEQRSGDERTFINGGKKNGKW